MDVVYRTPVAMVEVAGGGYLPIDRLGYLLPDHDFSPADVNRYPVVTGVSTVPIGNHGQAWGDPAVTGAAQLAAVLAKSTEDGHTWWNTLGLAGIAAPARLSTADTADDLHYEIITAGGSRIVWGRPPSTTHPGELSVHKKLERMAEYHRSYNGFDNGSVAYRIDIRDWQGTRRSLLVASEESSGRQ